MAGKTDKDNQGKKQSGVIINNKPFSVALGYLIANGRGITQTKVARAVGISQPYISDLVKGDRSGSETTRRDIAAFFEIAYDEFLDMGLRILNGVQNESPEINKRTLNQGGRQSVRERIFDKINRIELIDHRKLHVVETFIDGLSAGLPAEPLDQKKTGML